MSDYQWPPNPMGFPKFRRHQRADGRFEAEWRVELVSPAPPVIPLALRNAEDVEVQCSFDGEHTLVVRLISAVSPLLPHIFSAFYHLIQPAFDAGLIVAIEGAELRVHEFMIRGAAGPRRS